MSHHEAVVEAPVIFGMTAEFDNPEDIEVAAHKAREAGYTRLDAYTPFPIHGMSDAIGFVDNRLPWLIFFGGLTGCIFGFGLQCWINYIDYPLNIGGRPYIPWPSWIPVTFECTVLFAALTALVAMLGLNGLPRPHHPIFNAPRFDLATQDRFFLLVEARDPMFDEEKTAEFLRGLGAQDVALVEM